MAKKMTKTNAMRILETKGIQYNVRTFDGDGNMTAEEIAKKLGQPAERLFKTLVTTDRDYGYYVFCLPADEELDLKKGAKAAGVKKIEMLKQKDLFNLTGYVHGGCSPVGMKKPFSTFVQKSALDYETIFVSAGKIGMQIEIDPRELEKVIDVKFEDFVR